MTFEQLWWINVLWVTEIRNRTALICREHWLQMVLILILWNLRSWFIVIFLLWPPARRHCSIISFTNSLHGLFLRTSYQKNTDFVIFWICEDVGTEVFALVCYRARQILLNLSLLMQWTRYFLMNRRWGSIIYIIELMSGSQRNSSVYNAILWWLSVSTNTSVSLLLIISCVVETFSHTLKVVN